jgi:ubiquinone/menaquinone biosynthesis C-methylase UbiE
MPDFLTYDFGYEPMVRFAMGIPLLIAGAIAAIAWWQSWSRWVLLPALTVVAWCVVALLLLNQMINTPMPLPTDRFLASGGGRVLDVGAGSGRAAVGVLLARPRAQVTGVDIYSGNWGIAANTPERFMRNAQIAGVADRADARVGDMRQLPFADAEFDAVVSSYAVDHLRRSEQPKGLSEIARVLKPGGELLLVLVRVDWQTWLVSPILAHHPPASPAGWRQMLEDAGFVVEEEGEPFSTLYFHARKIASQTTMTR